MTRAPRPAARRLVELAISFFAGALFSVGLAVSGMTQPGKVIGFLDVAGDWDPSLAFVMLGAVTVYFFANRWAVGRPRPLVSAAFHWPAAKRIDGPLVAGGALFGVGWGLGGYCPGPAITSMGAASREALVFVFFMALGMLLFEAAQRLSGARRGEAQVTS